MATSRLFILLPVLALLRIEHAQAKCMPPSGFARVKSTSGITTKLVGASYYLAPGAIHLAAGDSLFLEVSPDCPSTLSLYHNGVLIGTSAQETTYAEFSFTQDGSYMISDDLLHTVYFTIDHVPTFMPLHYCAIDVKLFAAMSSTGAMDNALWTQQWIPVAEPYASMGYSFVGGGNETTTSSALYQQWSNVVDWIIIELRDANDPSVVIHSKCAFLLRNGRIQNHDHTLLKIPVLTGQYHVAVRHRNHLGVMTAQPVHFVGGMAPWINFTTTEAWGTNAQCLHTNYWGTTTNCLRPGNVKWTMGQQQVKYVGQNNDRDPILVRIGGTVVTATVSGYYTEDVNLDGVVKYTGAGNDRDPILQSIGGVVPTAVIVEQLP